MLNILQFIFAGVLIVGILLGINLITKKVSFEKIAEQFSNSFQAGSSTNADLPIQIQIPAININAAVVPVGLNSDNSLEIPPENEAGWYKYGAVPGQTGSSVIDGHLDTDTGPAIFWKLNKLKPGDQIIIGFGNGSKKTFIVSDSKTFPQDNFPTSEVYGNHGFAGLNLVTCAGTYSRSLGRYSDNIVVFAKAE